MPVYSSIIAETWANRTIYAESIPHLFHWDLAYLWVLEKDNLRPESWNDRVEAWRYLVSLLLLNELEMEKEPIKDPFLKFTSPYGINSVTWVRLKNTSKRIGVLSPTVLVRPLPDFSAQDLDQWKGIKSDPASERPEELQSFVSLAIKRLREAPGSRPHTQRLATILQAAFPQAGVTTRLPGQEFKVQLLSHLTWTGGNGASLLEDFEIIINKDGDYEGKVYVPACSKCGSLLTGLRKAEPIIINGESFTITCPQAGCGAKNDLILSDFFIWIRDSNRVVLWIRDGSFSSPDKGFPPRPVVNSDEVLFEWDPGRLEGEKARRFLTLRFPGRKIEEHRLDDIFFTKILVPGELPGFTGLPFRDNWLDAIDNLSEVNPKPDLDNLQIQYKGIDIKGLPATVSWSYGSLSLQVEKDLAAGLFPCPDKLPAGWKWHRVFLHGPCREKYRLKVDSGREILPWLFESEKEWDDTFSIISPADDGFDAGVTYRSPKPSTPCGQHEVAACVAVDFGSTNTLVYSLKGNEKPAPIPKSCGLKPADLSKSVHWISRPPDSESSDTIGDFLPGPRYREESSDSYLIPSAIWSLGAGSFIRWGTVEPVPAAIPKIRFKLDTYTGEFEGLRRAYLRELLLLSLPQIILDRNLPSDATFHMGFAYPLTLGFDDRNAAKKLLNDLCGDISNVTGLQITFSPSDYIDESHACEKAMGLINAEDSMLVADMGGGTMDVALVRNRQFHQIGSISFAGDNFIEVLAENSTQNPKAKEDFVLGLRDRIFNRKVTGKGTGKVQANPHAMELLSKFHYLAFEFIRTMMEAYRHNSPFGGIKLLLVGNGWHLVEGFSDEATIRDPKKIFEEYYASLIGLLDGGKASFYNKEVKLLDQYPSTKHLVVCGILQYMRKSGDQAEEEGLTKLPAGRGIRIRAAKQEGTEQEGRKIDWHQLVGMDEKIDGLSDAVLLNANMDFDLAEMPPLQPQWRSVLLDVFKVKKESEIPYPPDPILRQIISAGIKGKVPYLTKGPLQIILEQHWLNLLKKKH